MTKAYPPSEALHGLTTYFCDYSLGIEWRGANGSLNRCLMEAGEHIAFESVRSSHIDDCFKVKDVGEGINIVVEGLRDD